MKIHEYQAMNLMTDFDIPVQGGRLVDHLSQVPEALDWVENNFLSSRYVVKAQIHAGGRGKGGGVKLSESRQQATEDIQSILGMTLVTPQTGPDGQLVRKVLVTGAADIKQEFYAAVTLDRTTGRNVFMVSSEGGMDIEEVARNNPDRIVKETIVTGMGLRSFQSRNLAMALGLKGNAFKQAAGIFQKLYSFYLKFNCSIVEINPLILTNDDQIIAMDAKINFDDSAVALHPEIVEMRDLDEEDPAEVEAGKYDLNYVKLDGNIGCMVNGAGLAMATMDIIEQFGMSPANFLDVGGGANVETVKNGFRIILSDVNVKSVLVNIFGGIVRCDRIAHGIIEAVKELDLKVPVVVRLAGTNAEQAKDLLQSSGVKIISADSFQDAAQKAVDAARG